ncbi:hypothetical protein BDU57DRAFT_511421 [Ampelomyces quisqualis]|uniref:HRDC domain-containing protein n=1 Tax=Ampelomyces quisqualis TaxID=50730 RepID=A0A6A5QVU4_AMPQU|nr:hypothetical protein BDU57DRAFT_511421 [Ampelomyces quisqualis]
MSNSRLSLSTFGYRSCASCTVSRDTMPDAAPVAKDGKCQTEPSKAEWPLAYELQLPKQQTTLQNFGFNPRNPVKKSWWSHRLYRGPENKPVQILYSKTKDDSEKIVQQFLEEPVVGFDMEWPWNDWNGAKLQNKIGLIQVANESTIALFHIGLHPGKTPDDIIAPSLRKLIEDPKIGKLGVGILSADFARLRRYFHLKPRGAVELSHLYRLIKFGGWKPELVSTKLVSLARLVEDQLGHPLYKGDVRTSNWSKPLSQDQINYAAGDAYAGYMLYHYMNYKRLKMTPVSPLPIHAEEYLEYKLSGVIPLRLHGQTEEGAMMTSELFYGVSMTDSASSSKGQVKETTATPALGSKAPVIPKELTDATSLALYNELVYCRIGLAAKDNLPVYRVATNAILVSLALLRPLDKDQFLAIKGVGPRTYESYGDAWLKVIRKFVDPNSIPAVVVETTSAETTSSTSRTVEQPTAEPPSTPIRPSRSIRNQGDDPLDSSPAFGSPIQRTPTLHTGLSFTMAETNLDAGKVGTDGKLTSSDSNDSLCSLDFVTPMSKRAPRLKRKRTESLIRDEGTLTASQRLQQLTQQPTTPPPDASAPSTPKKSPTEAAAPLTPRSRITRNKLLAFSKLVTRKLDQQRAPNAPPIVSERTLSLIVTRAPRTAEELERIPGIDGLILACERTGMDLLKNVVKFAGGKGG